MNEQSEKTNVIGIINFHGITLWVIEQSGIEYVYAKPLSDLASLDWRRTKRTIIEDDNAELYGTTTLNHPVLAAEGGSGATPSEGLYLRLDRARMFLARISTKNMKAKGNVVGAKVLLKLQIEWAQVLHDYETTGVATKNKKLLDRREKEKSLIALLNARKLTTNQKERTAFDLMVAERIDDLGVIPDGIVTDDQGDMFSDSDEDSHLEN